jgi:hypothetical protein
MKSKGKSEDNPFAVLTRGLKFEKKDKGESKASPGSTGKRSSTVA